MQIDWQKNNPEIMIDGHKHVLEAPIQQAMIWPGEPLIVVLLARATDPLLLLGANGQARARFGQPPGYGMYLLVEQHRGGGEIMVVCGSNVPVTTNDWSDYHFTIPLDSGELVRAGPFK